MQREADVAVFCPFKGRATLSIRQPSKHSSKRDTKLGKERFDGQSLKFVTPFSYRLLRGECFDRINFHDWRKLRTVTPKTIRKLFYKGILLICKTDFNENLCAGRA